MSSDFSSKCRTCLSDSSNFYQLFDYVDENCRILEMLNDVVHQIDFMATSKFSNLICKSCVDKLLTGYKFQKLCLESNSRLYYLLDKTFFSREMLFDSMTDEISVQLKQENDGSQCIVAPMENGTSYNDMSIENENYTDIFEIIEFLDEHETNGSNFAGKEHNYDFVPNNRDGIVSGSSTETCSEVEEFLSENETNGFQGEGRRFKNIDIFLTFQNLDHESLLNVVPDHGELLQNEIGFTTNKSQNIDFAENCVIEKPRQLSKNIPCEHCSKRFNSVSALQRHIGVHSLARPLVCEICQYRFRTLKVLGLHRSTHHIDNSNSQSSAEGFKCPFCPRRFEKHASLRAHTVKHKLNSMVGDYCCKICQHRFRFEKYLVGHIRRTHPQAEKHKCNQCDKTFILRSRLVQHLNRHKGNKSVVCSICEKECNSFAKLREHMSTHSPQKYHEQITYPCTQCGAKLRTKATLRQHIKRRHKPLKLECLRRIEIKEELNTNIKKRPNQCPQCNGIFSNNYSLRRHMSTVCKITF